jgi:hypothetical protein
MPGSAGQNSQGQFAYAARLTLAQALFRAFDKQAGGCDAEAIDPSWQHDEIAVVKPANCLHPPGDRDSPVFGHNQRMIVVLLRDRADPSVQAA